MNPKEINISDLTELRMLLKMALEKLDAIVMPAIKEMTPPAKPAEKKPEPVKQPPLPA